MTIEQERLVTWGIGMLVALLLFALLRAMSLAGGRPRWGREAIGGAILLFVGLMPVGWVLLLACPGDSCNGDYFYRAIIAALIGLVGLFLCAVGAGLMIDGRRRDSRAGRRERRHAEPTRTED
jgi:hypothetical protein